MEIVRTAAELTTAKDRLDGRVALVPTMGALHEGHLELLKAARRASDGLVLSIFVNPLQFGPSEDLDSYPRPVDADLTAAEREGVDLAFVPELDEMCPAGSSSRVTVGPLGARLEGAARPGHFDGVATVVARLFNLVRPDVAYFGQKDAQQVAVVKQIVRDLGWPLMVEVCPTVRAGDGLALSSRNAYLSSSERRQATALWRSLKAGETALVAGGEPGEAERSMRGVFEAEDGVQLEYARAVDPETFEGWDGTGEVLLVVAAKVGQTRLIDNLPVYRDRR
ncbi:MAG: pantoate--beta-alanine ligase [Actinomycetota bacterium]